MGEFRKVAKAQDFEQGTMIDIASASEKFFEAPPKSFRSTLVKRPDFAGWPKAFRGGLEQSTEKTYRNYSASSLPSTL